MKHSFKIAVATATCVAVLALGAMGFAQQHGSHQSHGMTEVLAKMQKLGIKPSGLQMMLLTRVTHEYVALGKGVKDEAGHKKVVASQEALMLRLLNAEQQKAAIAEIIKLYPEAKGMKVGTPLVMTLAEPTEAQNATLKRLHEEIIERMKGMTEEELAVFHAEGKASAEMHAHIKAAFDEVYAMLTADQRREWDAVLAHLEAEKKRLKS